MDRRDFLKISPAIVGAGFKIANGNFPNMKQKVEDIQFPEWINNITDQESREIISQFYVNSINIGSDPEALRAKLKAFAETGELDPELLSENNIVQTGFILTDGTTTTPTIVDAERAAATVNTENPDIMLASSSKTFLVEGYLRLLEENGIDLSAYEFDVTTGGIADIAYRIGEFGGEKTYVELFPQFVNQETNLPYTNEELQALPERKINLDQLLYGILTLSTNSFLTSLKTLVMNTTGLSQEGLSQEIKRFAPNFRARAEGFTTKGLSNESQAEGYAEDKLEQIKRLLSSNDLISTEMLEHLKNNEANFGFDFGSSEIGMKLKEMGCEIFEKTGSYQCVYWMPELAKEGFPPHAIFLTSVNIKTPSGEIVSFVYYEIVEVPFSPDPADFPGDLVNGWPDEETPAYINYFLELARVMGPGFRTRMGTNFTNNVKLNLN